MNNPSAVIVATNNLVIRKKIFGVGYKIVNLIIYWCYLRLAATNFGSYERCNNFVLSTIRFLKLILRKLL